MTATKCALKMKALLSLGDKSIAQVNDCTATKTINSLWTLQIDVKFTPELWEVVSKGKAYDWKKGIGVPPEVRELCEMVEKKYLDACAVIAFENEGDAQETPAKESLIESPKEEEIIEQVGVEEAEETARLAREENVRKLAEYERLVQEKAEAEEKKIQAMETREKVKETPAPQKKNEWNKGGYKGVIQDAVYKETGPVKKIEVQRKPGRIIKGLTPRLAEKGKIKIGQKGKLMPTQTGKEFRKPQKIDHFEVTTMDKNEKDDYILDTEIMDKIGAGCRAINVRLPYDDPTLNFPTSYARYEGSECKCRGDGELAIENKDVISCNPETCPHYAKTECKPNGTLSVILDDAPTVGGVYKFRTVGWNSINNLISSMEFIRGLTNGFLAGLPLVMTLTPKHTTVPGTKIPTLIYMVNLEYRGSLPEMARAIKQTMDTRALMQYSIKDFEKLAVEALALPEAPEECKEIVEEFYPDMVRA